MNKTLHIVAFDAPAPPDYGGAIDLYYKIKALAETGLHIRLHYFGYKPERSHAGLEAFCKTINTYPRKSFWQCLHSPLPYIVASRINKNLVSVLNEDAHPVLLEGLHCTGILPYLRKDKKVTIRLHNNEALYYSQLAFAEKSLIRNLYYSMEATRLHRYQKKLPHTIQCAALSSSDVEFFQNKEGWDNVQFIPCFVPWSDVHNKEGLGSYCLYHGDLSVAANSAAVIWLLRHVFAHINIPFVIAGKAPGKGLQKIAAQYQHVQLIADPSDTVMEDLISNAQVNLLPALPATGVKLKLLHALFRGRHCITNTEGVAGSGLQDTVHICEDAGSIKKTIEQLMHQPLAEQEIEQRKAALLLYDNGRNATALSAWVC